MNELKNKVFSLNFIIQVKKRKTTPTEPPRPHTQKNKVLQNSGQRDVTTFYVNLLQVFPGHTNVTRSSREFRKWYQTGQEHRPPPPSPLFLSFFGTIGDAVSCHSLIEFSGRANAGAPPGVVVVGGDVGRGGHYRAFLD